MDIHAPPENLPRILDVTSNFHKLVLARIANKEYCPHAWHTGSGWSFKDGLGERSYFFLRLKKPAATEPNPSRPNKGNGEAVWGSFCPEAALLSAEAMVPLEAGAAL
jgi:hypothetical protein